MFSTTNCGPFFLPWLPRQSRKEISCCNMFRRFWCSLELVCYLTFFSWGVLQVPGDNFFKIVLFSEFDFDLLICLPLHLSSIFIGTNCYPSNISAVFPTHRQKFPPRPKPSKNKSTVYIRNSRIVPRRVCMCVCIVARHSLRDNVTEGWFCRTLLWYCSHYEILLFLSCNESETGFRNSFSNFHNLFTQFS